MTYDVPISPSGEFSELFDNAPKNAYVSTEYLAPFIQLFYVVYDCGVDYRTAQIVLPISPRCTRLFQICWEFSSGSDEVNQNLLLADKKVWMEDKRIIEACSINSGDMLDTYYNGRAH